MMGEFGKVEGYNYNTSCKDIKDEDNCNVLFRFENETLGIISVSWCNEPMELLELYGTKGTLIINFHSNDPISFTPKKLKRNEFIKRALEYESSSDISQHLLINHFINCILKGIQEHTNFNDGKRATEFVLDAYSFKKSV